MIRVLTATGWVKQKKTHMTTYKAVIRQALEYGSSIWSPLASSTSINKLQGMYNAALRTVTGCTQDTYIQQLHDETLILHIHTASRITIQTKPLIPSHPLHKYTTYFNTSRLKHYLQQRPLHNKHSHTPHTFTTTDTKQTCVIYIHLLSLGI